MGLTLRAMTGGDWTDVLRVYVEGLETGIATFETKVPDQRELDTRWLEGQRWIADLDGAVAGWAALAPVSTRECYAGVVESSIYVSQEFRGRGIGAKLVAHQVEQAHNAGLWTLQTSIFTVNRPSIALHESAGFRIVGMRERIAQRDGKWHDTVLLEHRART